MELNDVPYYVQLADGEIDMAGSPNTAKGASRSRRGSRAGHLTAGQYSMASGGSFVTRFMDTGGMVDVDRVADAFHMSKGQLAETAGLGVATVSKADRRTSPRAQMRVTEMLEIISRIREWAGGEAQEIGRAHV